VNPKFVIPILCLVVLLTFSSCTQVVSLLPEMTALAVLPELTPTDFGGYGSPTGLTDAETATLNSLEQIDPYPQPP
jgi:hypothetical protein